MDIFARLMIRMTLWIRRRPSRQWLITATCVIILCAVVVSLEAAGYWPDSWTAQKLPRAPGMMRH